MKRLFALLLAVITLASFCLTACEDAVDVSSAGESSLGESSIEESALESSGKEESSEPEVPPIEPAYCTVISTGAAYTVSKEADSAYADSYGKELTDGQFGPATEAGYGDEKFSGYATGGGVLAISLDLGEVYETIYRFEVSYLNVNEAGIAAPSTLHVYISEDGENYTVVYEGAAGGFASEPVIVNVELDNVSAHYIKVSTFGEGGNYFSIWELCAYGEKVPAEPTNVALNRPITVTSVQGGSGMVGEFAVDGNDTTRWAAEPTVPSELIVDFQGLCALTQITVSFEQIMMNHTISVSEDGENYTVVYEGAAGGFASEPVIVNVELDNVVARYVKISSFGEGGNYFSVWELTAMGVALEEIPELPVNVALNKTATATSTQDSHVAQNAIDGDMTTRWGANPQGTCDLVIDLGALYVLNNAEVTFEQCLMNYTISVSENGENYTVVYEGASEGWLNSLKTNTYELNNVTARFVKFTRLPDDGTTDFWFSIVEAKIYGVNAE